MAEGDVVVVNTNSRAFNANVFDGVDDYVEIPHNAAQLGANLSNGFTISVVPGIPSPLVRPRPPLKIIFLASLWKPG